MGVFIGRHVGSLDANDEAHNDIGSGTNIAGVDNSQSWNTNNELDDLGDFEFDTFGTSNNDEDLQHHFGSFDNASESISFGDSS